MPRMRVKVPYKPRRWARPFHASLPLPIAQSGDFQLVLERNQPSWRVLRPVWVWMSPTISRANPATGPSFPTSRLS